MKDLNPEFDPPHSFQVVPPQMVAKSGRVSMGYLVRPTGAGLEPSAHRLWLFGLGTVYSRWAAASALRLVCLVRTLCAWMVFHSQVEVPGDRAFSRAAGRVAFCVVGLSYVLFYFIFLLSNQT